MCECLLVLRFTKERNVDPSTSETSVLTVWHFIFFELMLQLNRWTCVNAELAQVLVAGLPNLSS